MAKLLTIDVTNTCIKVAGSVGHQYVSLLFMSLILLSSLVETC